MSLHYTLMGNSKKAQNKRVKHGQDQAVREEDTKRDLERDRLKNSLHGENAHVGDCLVWNQVDGSGQEGSGNPHSPRKHDAMYGISRGNEFRITNYKPLPRHPELGRARNHLYGEDGPPNLQFKPKSLDGGVSDAMVGWPRERQLEEERQGRSGVGWDIDVREGKSPPMTRRNQRLEEGDSDAVMNDLISHSYMRDNEQRLQQLREQQMLDQVTVQRNRHTFRDNKASVLRSEAINAGGQGGYYSQDPKDLWKMSRFTNAKSRLNDCTECKRHDCYHEDGRGFPMEPIRTDGKKCGKGSCKGLCEKGTARGMGDKSGNQSQEETNRPCACCQQHHHQDPEEYPYHQHQQPDEDYPRNGLYVL